MIQNSCFCSPTSAGDSTHHLRKWHHLFLASSDQGNQISILDQQPRQRIDKARSISCWEIGEMGSRKIDSSFFISILKRFHPSILTTKPIANHVLDYSYRQIQKRSNVETEQLAAFQLHIVIGFVQDPKLLVRINGDDQLGTQNLSTAMQPKLLGGF